MKETQPIQIGIAAPLFPEAVAFLQAHGCRVRTARKGAAAGTEVTLPVDTKRRLVERVASDHYEITLPDGVILKQKYDPGTGMSTLYIPAQPGMEERLYSPEPSRSIGRRCPSWGGQRLS